MGDLPRAARLTLEEPDSSPWVEAGLAGRSPSPWVAPDRTGGLQAAPAPPRLACAPFGTPGAGQVAGAAPRSLGAGRRAQRGAGARPGWQYTSGPGARRDLPARDPRQL